LDESDAVSSIFSQSWPFDFGTTANYTFDTSKLDFTGGVCRLTGNDQVDDDNTVGGFLGGTLSGTEYDATNSFVRLSQTGSPTNTAELDSSWTPNYANILGYWKLNGSGAIAASDPITATIGTAGSTWNANGTGMDYVPGKLNQGITFDGVDDSIRIDNPGLSFTNNSFTVTGWFKADASSVGTIGIFTTLQWDGSYNNLNWTEINITASDEIYFSTVDTTDTLIQVGGGSFRDGKWHHFAAVRNESMATASIYVDTHLVASASDTRTGDFNLASSPSVMVIAQDTSRYFDGTLDEFTLWDGALTTSDIAKLYDRQSATYSGTVTSRVMDALAAGLNWTTLSWVPTLPFLKEMPDYAGGAIQNESSTDYASLVGSTGAVGDNDLMTGIVGLWHLNETAATGGAGNDIQDDSGGAHSGEAFGTVEFGVNGKLGRAAGFDGASGYIDYGNTLDPTPNMTISAWVNPQVPGALMEIISKEDANGYGYMMRVDSNQAYVGFFNGSYPTVNSSTSVTPGQWVHLVGIRNSVSGTVSIYLNGVYESQVAAGAAPVASTSNLLIGNSPVAAHFFNGAIDEVAVWSRALDPKEVLQLYRRGANRIKHQVRICTAADCSDDASGAHWKGPDGTNQTYFSELNNNTSALDGTGDVMKSPPSMLFSDFTSPVGTSRYFQYRAILESDDSGTGCDYGSGATWCSPELRSVAVDPLHYDSSSPTIVGHTGVSFGSLVKLMETLGASCPAGISYNLGIGADYSSATWYWWDATANAGAGGWGATNGTVTESNDAATINAHAAAFSPTLGVGVVYFKAFLKSSGSSKCELDHLSLSVQ